MKKVIARAVFSLGAFCLLLAGTASAQGEATQDVTIEVREVNAFGGPGGGQTLAPITLTINSATPGEALNSATDNSTTYAVTTNASNRKITAQLDGAYADGITLSADMQAPSEAASNGPTILSTTAQDLVTDISQQKGAGLTITYEATAALTVAPADYEATVTYTLTN